MENDCASPPNYSNYSISFIVKLFRGTTLPHSSNRVLQLVLSE